MKKGWSSYKQCLYLREGPRTMVRTRSGTTSEIPLSCSKLNIAIKAPCLDKKEFGCTGGRYPENFKWGGRPEK